MKNQYLTLFLVLFLSGCSTSKLITDQESHQLQKEMRRSRTGVNIADAGIYLGSAVLSAATGIEIQPESGAKNFRKIRIENTFHDTLIVNMVTDILWKEDQYCDIRDILIPPLQTIKVIAPIDASYNIYFRTNPDSEDQVININTSERRRIKLKPEITPLPEQ